jgi:predicted nucleic acid-binding protein
MEPIANTIERMHGQSVYLDANVFIYFTNETKGYYELVTPILSACRDRKILGVTGKAAIAEVMVHPYRTGDAATISRFKQFFAQKNFLSVVAHGDDLFDTTAMIAAERGMRLMDAFHYATALQAHCTYLVTGDRKFKDSEHLKVICLRDYLSEDFFKKS